MPQKYDVNEPILVLVRRGRKGRGFTVCPVEDVANPAVCTDSKDMGEVIEEFLNDESQPRVNVSELLQAAKGEAPPNRAESKRSQKLDEEVEDDEDEYEDEYEDEEEGEGGIFDGVAGSEDPAGQLLINVLSGAMTQGRKMSSKRVKSRGGRRRKKKSKKSS